MEPAMESRPLFVGRRDGTLVQFVCFNLREFAIVRGEQVLRLEQDLTLEDALDRFLSMIDRPAPRLPNTRTNGGSDRLLCA